MFTIRKVQEQMLHEAVQAESNAATADEVVYGKEKSALAENDSAWVRSAMQRLESKFDFPARKNIRMHCQCGYGMEEKLALLKELMVDAASIEELTSTEKARAAGLFCKDGGLYLQFDFCPCPMLAHVDRLESDTWCLCTTGYSKVLFEAAFSCEADVSLLKSIKRGDACCLMKITLHHPVWK